jgi:GC-rich sequence DNA-binding factor
VIAENMWDPFSTTQTSRMVGITLKLINGYPSVVNAENKNTQVILIPIFGKLFSVFS